jgi:hypothetical protein
VRAVAAAERATIASWADRQLGLALCSSVTGCGRQGYSDHSVLVPIRMGKRVGDFLGDNGQRRTGSGFERRCLAAFAQLRPVIVDVPVRSILGASGGPDRHVDLISWNEASALAEGNNTPYFAARGIVSVEIFRPADPFGLVEALSDLRMRYEDEPDTRDTTSAEITAVLDDFRARAPLPITT